MNLLSSQPTNVICNKVKIFLCKIGLNERYRSFEYLANIMCFMIKQNNFFAETYKQALTEVSSKFNVTKKAILSSVSELIKICTNEQINLQLQCNFCKKSMLNKIRILIQHVNENY